MARVLNLFFVFFGVFSTLSAQDISKLAGDLTSSLPGRAAVQVNAPNILDQDRRNTQLSGFGLFHGSFLKSQGLGPTFINSACGGCHIGNGKGPLGFNNTVNGSTMVVKLSLQGLNKDGSPKNVPGIGEQLLDKSVLGLNKSNTKIKLAWTYTSGKYADGTKYRLRKPKLSFTIKGQSTRKMITSLRMTPTVIGVGLLEAVSESDIYNMSDPSDRNKDGVRGHPNIVPDVKTGTKKYGRFGFKASHTTVEQQTAAAFRHDMGLTSYLFKSTNGTYEVPDDTLNKVTYYQKLAGVPFARNQGVPAVIRGKDLFQKIGCNSCHRMTLRTGTHEDPELSNQEIHPFTDLLLHNMGLGLADKRAEHFATGAHWRTTPLWGLGYSRQLADRGQQATTFLHDGRARTIDEAILWHGGEAAISQKKFTKLNRLQRSDLIAFLKSL